MAETFRNRTQTIKPFPEQLQASAFSDLHETEMHGIDNVCFVRDCSKKFGKPNSFKSKRNGITVWKHQMMQTKLKTVQTMSLI